MLRVPKVSGTLSAPPSHECVAEPYNKHPLPTRQRRIQDLERGSSSGGLGQWRTESRLFIKTKIKTKTSLSQTMASEWQTAFIVSHKMPWCALLTAVKNHNKSLENLQDFFSKTETKTKTKCSRPSPRLHDPRHWKVQDFHCCPRGASRPRSWSRGVGPHHWSGAEPLVGGGVAKPPKTAPANLPGSDPACVMPKLVIPGHTLWA